MPGQLRFPRGIAVDADGDVTEWMLNRVQEFAADGVHLWTWDGDSDSDYSLDEPVGIAITGRGTLLVADYGHGQVLELVVR